MCVFVCYVCEFVCAYVCVRMYACVCMYMCICVRAGANRLFSITLIFGSAHVRHGGSRKCIQEGGKGESWNIVLQIQIFNGKEKFTSSGQAAATVRRRRKVVASGRGEVGEGEGKRLFIESFSSSIHTPFFLRSVFAWALLFSRIVFLRENFVFEYIT